MVVIGLIGHDLGSDNLSEENSGPHQERFSW